MFVDGCFLCEVVSGRVSPQWIIRRKLWAFAAAGLPFRATKGTCAVASEHPFVMERYHNGINLTLFKPGNRELARKELSLPTNTNILLFVANQAKTNPFKDYPTLEKALFLIANNQKYTKKILLLCVGEDAPCIKKNNIEIQFIGYTKNREELIRYYQAADIFIHATNSDNFPTTILEALACGLPIIGTNLGGIPEQIAANSNPTGMLYELENHEELAHNITFLLTQPRMRETMSHNAIIDARNRFDVKKQVQQYTDYYSQILNQQKK